MNFQQHFRVDGIPRNSFMRFALNFKEALVNFSCAFFEDEFFVVNDGFLSVYRTMRYLGTSAPHVYVSTPHGKRVCTGSKYSYDGYHVINASQNHIIAQLPNGDLGFLKYRNTTGVGGELWFDRQLRSLRDEEGVPILHRKISYSETTGIWYGFDKGLIYEYANPNVLSTALLQARNSFLSAQFKPDELWQSVETWGTERPNTFWYTHAQAVSIIPAGIVVTVTADNGSTVQVYTYTTTLGDTLGQIYAALVTIVNQDLGSLVTLSKTDDNTGLDIVAREAGIAGNNIAVTLSLSVGGVLFPSVQEVVLSGGAEATTSPRYSGLELDPDGGGIPISSGFMIGNVLGASGGSAFELFESGALVDGFASGEGCSNTLNGFPVGTAGFGVDGLPFQNAQYLRIQARTFNNEDFPVEFPSGTPKFPKLTVIEQSGFSYRMVFKNTGLGGGYEVIYWYFYPLIGSKTQLEVVDRIVSLINTDPNRYMKARRVDTSWGYDVALTYFLDVNTVGFDRSLFGEVSRGLYGPAYALDPVPPVAAKGIARLSQQGNRWNYYNHKQYGTFEEHPDTDMFAGYIEGKAALFNVSYLVEDELILVDLVPLGLYENTTVVDVNFLQGGQFQHNTGILTKSDQPNQMLNEAKVLRTCEDGYGIKVTLFAY